jgi:2-C-methyl-D-erythritol 2,4-cyclodiphosphate synthase
LADFRVGFGFDAHKFSSNPPILLAGVVVDTARGVDATSDGDLVAHAVADGILGACGLGDIGEHFPSDDPRSAGASSMRMLLTVFRLARASRWWINNVDVTVIAEDLRIAPFRKEIAEALGAILECEQVSVKATSTDGMGFIGKGEGLAVAAVVTVTI